MEVRAAFAYDVDKVSLETGLKCEDPSLAKQADKDSCDINTIVKRFGLLGRMEVPSRLPTYADYSNVTDFHTAMSAIAESREMFEALPANVRARFHNDPGQFVDFCSNAENREEAVSLGLITKAAAKLATEEALSTVAAPPVGVGGDGG